MGYFLAGNQQDGRVGPQAMPTVLGTLVTLAEPLFLKTVVLANRTAGSLVATVHVVVADGVAGTSTQVVPGATIPGNDTLTYSYGDGIPLAANETVQHLASDVGLNIIAVFSRRHR